MKIEFREIMAAVLVIAALVAVPVLVWSYEKYSFIRKYGSEAKIFKLTAAGGQGRVTRARVGGYNYWSGRFPRLDTIRVNKGDKVVLVIKSADVTHRFRIRPRLDNVEQYIEMEGGHTKVVNFRADKPGLHFLECSSFCGCPHHAMFFKLEILDTSIKTAKGKQSGSSQRMAGNSRCCFK